MKNGETQEAETAGMVEMLPSYSKIEMELDPILWSVILQGGYSTA